MNQSYHTSSVNLKGRKKRREDALVWLSNIHFEKLKRSKELGDLFEWKTSNDVVRKKIS